MTDDAAEARLFGQVHGTLPPSALAEALRRAGLDAHCRASSLFDGGEYVRVRASGDAHAALERTGPGAYLVHDAAGDPAAMAGLARALAAALTALDLPHRLELYTGTDADEDAPAAYHAHRWPADAH